MAKTKYFVEYLKQALVLESKRRPLAQNRIVAVVDALHIPGIEALWDSETAATDDIARHFDKKQSRHTWKEWRLAKIATYCLLLNLIVRTW